MSVEHGLVRTWRLLLFSVLLCFGEYLPRQSHASWWWHRKMVERARYRSFITCFFGKVFLLPVCDFLLSTVFLKSSFSFWWSPVYAFICSCMIVAFGFISKKSLPSTRSQSFSLMLSFRSVVVWGLTFRSMAHFIFFFFYDIKYGYKFILLHMDIQLFQHHLLKRLRFLHFMPLLLCHNQLAIYVWAYLWALFCLIDLFGHLCTNIMLF